MSVIVSDGLNGIQPETISGLEDFARLLGEISSTEQAASRRWLFRGESWEPGREESVELISKAGRVGGEERATRRVTYDVEHEIAALDTFKKQARPHLRHQPQNDLEWLAVAEHHGMATRLLDWKQSLLVAVYFATKYAGERNRYGLVFGVPDLPMVEPSDEEDPLRVSKVKVYLPPHISARIPHSAAFSPSTLIPLSRFARAGSKFGESNKTPATK